MLPDGAEYGDMQDDALCSQCITYAGELRRYKMERGFENDCDFSDSDYENFKKTLTENILYDFDLIYGSGTAAAAAAKTHFSKTADVMESLMCQGVHVGKICRQYAFCVCLAGSYSFEETENFHQHGVCLKCPEGQMSVVSGDNGITSCYKPASAGFSNSNGSGIFTENCYWIK